MASERKVAASVVLLRLAADAAEMRERIAQVLDLYSRTPSPW